MAGSAFLDVCRFTPTLGGTTDWTYSSAVTGYQSPAAAGAVNGAQYSYRAESADLSQWEMGVGTYNTSTGVLSRTTILFSTNSNAKVTFSTVPQVALVELAEDMTVTTAAAKSDQQTGTSAKLAVTPAHQQDHDSAAKAWAIFTGGRSPTISAGSNVASISSATVGFYTIVWTTPFATANYSFNAILETTPGTQTGWISIVDGTRTASQIQIVVVGIVSGAAATFDPVTLSIQAFGRQ